MRFLGTTLGFCLALAAWGEELPWRTFQGHRILPLRVPASAPQPGFDAIAPATSQIRFVNDLAQSTSITNQIYLNGSGVAIGDIDGDDRPDLYFCGLESENQLYRNLGNWTFHRVSDQPQLGCTDQASTGAAFADVDGDRDVDLLVNGIRRGTRLFLNDGIGRFTEATESWGLQNTRGSASLTLADINGDAWLDLYVVNYRNETMRDEPDSPFDVRVKEGQYELVSYRGRPGTSPDLVGRFSFDRESGVLENGQADQLFLNTGDNSFYPVAWDEGLFLDEQANPISPPYDWGLSAMFRDLNGDLAPDLYVCNDFQSPDRVWINDGTGTFQPLAQAALQQTSLFSMGIDVADINRDGHADFFVCDMLSLKHSDRHVQVMEELAFSQYRNTDQRRPQTPRNTLLLNRGDGSFSEIARFARVDASYWSWCPIFLDVDLDGYEDLLITTGHGRDAQNTDIASDIDQEIQEKSLDPAAQLQLRHRYPELKTPNVAFRNNGNLGFSDASMAWNFDSDQISHGSALGDLDGDGDLDIVVTCLNAPPLILRNRSHQARLRVTLKGYSPDSHGIGARVEVTTPGMPVQSQEIIAGGRYLSSDEPTRVFAMASAESLATIQVTWRDGTRTQVPDVMANHWIEISQAASPPPKKNVSPTAKAPSLFKHQPSLLAHRHVDRPFDDMALQNTLPHKLSEPGPGVSWFDFNGDGWEDLFLSAGRGGKMGVFRNAGGKQFVRQKASAFAKPVPQDQACILGWQPSATDRALLIGQTNHEAARSSASPVRQFSVVTGQSRDDFLNSKTSLGALTMGDLDADGDLDLFVGGAHQAGSYPRPQPSYLLRNQQGTLTADPALSHPCTALGLVRSATFARLNHDRFPELIVAGHWMPLVIFRNQEGTLKRWNPVIKGTPPLRQGSSETRLDDLAGWWNSVSTGDFDGDGRLDLVAGNWGDNWRDTPESSRRRLYYEEIQRPGGRMIEAYYHASKQHWLPVRDRGWTIQRFPEINQAYPSFARFASASIQDLLVKGQLKLASLEASFFRSVILLNRGDHFELRALPNEAQFAPVFGIAVADFDLSGTHDLVIHQNFHSTSSISGRQDAGGLLFLRGDGTGRFTPVAPLTSGLNHPGQGRSVATCDFNHDGRPDFVSTLHAGQSRLYQNQSPRTGIRITLQGPPNNLAAVGASARIVYPGPKYGPRMEVSLGSGYSSQHASTLVLGAKTSPIAVEIRWPSGQTVQYPIDEQTDVLRKSQPQAEARRATSNN